MPATTRERYISVDGPESQLFLGGAIESMRAKTPRLFLEVDKGEAGLRIAEPEGRTANFGIEHNRPSPDSAAAERRPHLVAAG
jgi:hypothetical protein